MGTLGTLVENLQLPVKSKVPTEWAHCELFLKRVTLPTDKFLHLNFVCQFT